MASEQEKNEPKDLPGSHADDDDAPRMNWPADAASSSSASTELARPQSESMARKALRAVSGSMRRFSFGSASSSNGEGADRGSSLSRMMGGADGDIRSGSLGRIIFSEDSSGKMKAFRNVRKLASSVRKTVTGKSSSEAAFELEASRKFQQVSNDVFKSLSFMCICA